jgi:hypothetical protein
MLSTRCTPPTIEVEQLRFLFLPLIQTSRGRLHEVIRAATAVSIRYYSTTA